MPAIALKAHYDGQQILLDEKFDLPKKRDSKTTLHPSTSSGRTGFWKAQLIF